MDYEQKRRALLERIRVRLLEREAGFASLREIAAGAGVTYPTIRHYFAARDDLVEALLGEYLEQGRPYLEAVRKPTLPFEASITEAVAGIDAGIEAGLGAVLAVGLIEGLHHERLGPAYLERLLDLTLDALADRLGVHLSRGEMRPCEPRFAALSLASPLILAYLHQEQLGGCRTWPLELVAFAQEHRDAFVRAHLSS
jgi:AcrR family transcriptional regulator